MGESGCVVGGVVDGVVDVVGGVGVDSVDSEIVIGC